MPAAPMWALAPSPSQAIFDGGRVLDMEQKHGIAALTVAAAPARGTAPTARDGAMAATRAQLRMPSACRN